MAEEGSEFWFCAASDGSLKTVERDELVLSLKQGNLTGQSLVWRPGWAEWLSAGQVAELSSVLPAFMRAPIVSPKLDPDLTHPPPVPPRAVMLDPIVPVASTPENDKPRTQLLVEIELPAAELAVVRPPPPSRRSSAPPPPSRKGTPLPPRPASVARSPIIPVASTPQNDKPNTEVIRASEIVIEDKNAPPQANWVEVAPQAKDAVPEPASARAAEAQAPIIPVDSNPHHEPITGMLDDDEIQIVEAAAGATAKKAPEKAPASLPSLDSLARAVEAKKPPKPQPVIAVKAAPAPRPAPPPVAPAAVVPAAPVQAPLVQPSPLGQTLPLAAAPVAAAPLAPAPLAQTLPLPPAPPAILPGPEPQSEAPTRVADAIVPVSEPDNEAPTQIHPAALRPDAEALPSWSEEVDTNANAAAVPLPAPPQPGNWQTPQPAPVQQYAQYPSYAPPQKKSALPLILGGLAVVGLVGAAAVGGLLYFKPWQSATEASAKPSATQAASAKAPAATAGPKLAVGKEATRLAPAVQLSVPPYVAVNGGKVSVGIATSEVAGAGLVVDAGTLEVEEAHKAPAGKKIIGVVPVASDKDRFVTDRDGGSLQVPHTVDAETVFAIGFSGKGYARVVKGAAPEEIWPDVENEKATEARVASVAGVGHVVTFRTGGKVRVGWLKPNGSRKGELGAVQADGRAGTPTIAANDQSVLVAFAGKSGDDAPWGVRLATAKHGELPKSAETFSVPAGGPGGDAIAPVAAGLSDGRWLLQWTEGGAGERVVRVQVLSPKLEPQGDALKVSAPGKEAGQGVVAVAQGHALSLQLVKADSGYELWGTSLSLQ